MNISLGGSMKHAAGVYTPQRQRKKLQRKAQKKKQPLELP